MTSMFASSVFTLLLLTPALFALPDGAPPDVCLNGLVPQHSSAKKGSGSGPYSLTASAATFKGGKPITVTLSGPASKPFKGYVIQAQYSDGTTLEGGQWTETKDFQELPCAAVTHRNRDDKDKVTATFTPPEGEGDVIFVATVVENYRSYYANIRTKSSTRSTTLAPTDDRIGHQSSYEPNSPNYSPFYETQSQEQVSTDPAYSSPQYDPQYVAYYQQTANKQYAPSRGDFAPAPAPYNQYEEQAGASAFAPAPSAQYVPNQNVYPAGFNNHAAFVSQSQQQPQSFMIPNNGQQRYSPYNNQQRHDTPSMYPQQQYVPQQQMQQFSRYQPYMQPAYNHGQRRYYAS